MTDFRTWLAGPQDFAQGLQLYEQHPDARPALVGLMQRGGPGSFTSAQLLREIERLAGEAPASLPATAANAPAPRPATAPADPAELPAEVAALVAERNQLFKESSNLQARLRDMASDPEREAAARTILANFERGDEIWDALRYFNQHGALPPAAEPGALLADPVEATRRRNTLRTYLSSKRGTPEKRAAWQAELAALERKLKP